MKYQGDFISGSFVFFVSEHNPKKLLGKAKSENVNTLVNQPTLRENRTSGGGEAAGRDCCGTSPAPGGKCLPLGETSGQCPGDTLTHAQALPGRF